MENVAPLAVPRACQSQMGSRTGGYNGVKEKQMQADNSCVIQRYNSPEVRNGIQNPAPLS